MTKKEIASCWKCFFFSKTYQMLNKTFLYKIKTVLLLNLNSVLNAIKRQPGNCDCHSTHKHQQNK